MRILVTGVGGQLGWDVCRRLDELGIANRGADIADFDLTDAQATSRAISQYMPDCVAHCAAYTAVEKAETNRALCEAVNVRGTANVADACIETGARMLYVSTDYVFGGDGDAFYETDAPKHPQNAYGETKLRGEFEAMRVPKHYVVRTSWVFGKNGSNFVKTMLRLGGERERVSVVSDQIGSPTYSRDLARLLCELMTSEKYGIYHATNEGVCSFFEFAREIMRLAGLRCEVTPVSTAEYGSAVRRPLNSRLSKESLDQAGFARLPHWRDALERYLNEISRGG